jgi:hypothetical protein
MSVSVRFIRISRAPGLKKADMLIHLELRSKAPNQEVSVSTSLLYHAFDIRGYATPLTPNPDLNEEVLMRQDVVAIVSVARQKQSAQLPKGVGHVASRQGSS